MNLLSDAYLRYLKCGLYLLSLTLFLPTEAATMPFPAPADSPQVTLPYPFQPNQWGGLYLNPPSNIKSEFIYNPETGHYEYHEKIGNFYYTYPTYYTFDEYLKYDWEKRSQQYWKEKKESETVNDKNTKPFAPSIKVENEAFDRIFGGNKIELRPTGIAELSFGLNTSRRDNPALPVRQRKVTTFDFNEKIQLNLIGQIGEKLKISTSYNTEATFDFENQMKIEYTGHEDEIIQKIEAGNVSLPTKGSLITGSQTLFGIKTALKFGRLTVTTVLSQERGEKKEIEISGGAQVQTFEKSASDYEANKHFFLSQFFRDLYEQALASPPLINSRINITRIEVWVTNVNRSTENTRNIIAFQDLGEGNPNHIYRSNLITDNNPLEFHADNNANNLYSNLQGGYINAADIRSFYNAIPALNNLGYNNGIDYEVYENARMLSASEYQVNAQLGYISLSSQLGEDDILAVAYQYTYNGKTYQVGEFSTDGITGKNALYLKLLKSTVLNTKIPMWDLMMKNVYAIGAYNVNPANFQLDIWYLNPETGYEIPFLPEGSLKGQPLTMITNLDRLDQVNAPGADGNFDFIAGVTIHPQTGRIYFPLLEPFGKNIYAKFPSSEQNLAKKYAYDSLYRTTQLLAKLDAIHNRYTIKGKYSSSTSSEISLNAMNIPQGSVVVTAGGNKLVENVDYTVDYNLGRIKIINQGLLESGQSIKVSLENNAMFAIQTKNFIGSRFDYKVNNDVNLGGTIINLTERPLTQKINMGYEPISNTIVGVDGTYTKEMPLLTRLADLLPFYATKEKSSISVQGEAAYLIPGNSRAITKEGVAYIDDFEGSQTTIDLTQAIRWKLASVPQKQPTLWPEGNLFNNLAAGYNRAKLAWYQIDPLFWQNDSRTPEHIKSDKNMVSNHYMRKVDQTEVFPNKSLSNNIITNIQTLDLAFYPDERGPYNFDANPSPYSAGVDPNTGKLLNPASRWGGIMRDLQTTDFESSNIQYIQFWLMDPFDPEDGDPNHPGGDLYIHLGNISEDILPDGRKSFENGFPTDATITAVDTTAWGRVPTSQTLVYAFNNDPQTRKYQDVGLDGLNDNEELTFFQNFYNSLSPAAQLALKGDIASDNYHYYRGSDYDNAKLNILERYKYFNNPQGNSPTDEDSPEDYPTSATVQPDVEDINIDNNQDKKENYYQYRIRLTPQDLQPQNVGKNYITSHIVGEAQTPNGVRKVNWYQFKIPIYKPDNVVGDIYDFKSIRYIRLITKGFSKPVVLRFATFDLVRGDWRPYQYSLISEGEYIQNDEDETTFDIGAVNIEENSSRYPIPYVLPPGIQRQVTRTANSANLIQMNEQAVTLRICNLKDGDARAAFKNVNIDIRRYKRLKMFTHLESLLENDVIYDNEISVFIRLGTDFDNNYYEYETPLKATPWGKSLDKDIWPEYNNIDIELEKLISAKQERNLKLLDPQSGVSINQPYIVSDYDENNQKNNYIRIKGNPNLANVKTIIIGVRNRRKSNDNPYDNGNARCIEVWINELRLTDFDNKGGWATTGRVTANIADLGNVSLSATMSTPGWGSIDKKLNERQLDTRKRYDLASNIELGKFLPSEWKVKVPFFYGISEEWSQPRYNPLDPDVEFNKFLSDNETPKHVKDSVKKRVETYQKNRSINFTNVHKEKSGGKTHLYDIENFSFNYAYIEVFKRDINTEYDFKKNYKGGVAYNYSPKPRNYAPFEKIKFIKKSKWLKPIKDFNFYLVPKQFGFTTSFDRSYNERERRNNTGLDVKMPAFYQKSFYWQRSYSLSHDFTKSLKFKFDANANSIIGEPPGRVDKDYKEEYQQWKDSVYRSVATMGLITQYRHTGSLDYAIPLNKFPLFDFITANARYTGNYDWKRAPIGADSLGHTIQNSNQKQLNVQFNLLTLYNKSKFLKEIRNPTPKPTQKTLKPPKANLPKTDQKADTSKKEKKQPGYAVLKGFFYGLTSLENFSINYSEERGTLLPAWGRQVNILGFDPQFDAPGYEFISGWQNDNFVPKAAQNGWLVNKGSLMYTYNKTLSKNLDLKASLRPLKTLKIDLNANRRYGENFSHQFFWDEITDPSHPGYNFQTPPNYTGNFSITFLSFKTAFVKDDKKTFDSENFKNFLRYRQSISQRIGTQNTNSYPTGNYYDGYGPTQQNVLIHSLKAAYGGFDPNTIPLQDFPTIPLPNWRINYSGLTQYAFIRQYFRNLSINHSYRSTYNVASFTANLLYAEDANGNPIVKDANNNYINRFQIQTVSITEQFAPLVGFDATLKNSLLVKVEYKKDRNISLSLNNNQITEIKGHEFVIGTGYKFKNIKFPIKMKKQPVSDFDLKTDFSIRTNNNIIRQIVDETNQLTGGQRVFTIKITGDYKLSDKLTLRIFYDKVRTIPFISTTFPTGNTNFGFALRFMLNQ